MVRVFLPDDQWSPRFEKEFYTIRLKKYSTLDKPSEIIIEANAEDDACQLFGFCNSQKKYPAVYYEIEVLSGTTTHTCLRRYSQFHLLCKKLDPSGDMGLKKILPPKTAPFQKLSNDFLEERMSGLNAFLEDVLIRKECVNNSLIEQFLELNDDN